MYKEDSDYSNYIAIHGAKGGLLIYEVEFSGTTKHGALAMAKAAVEAAGITSGNIYRYEVIWRNRDEHKECVLKPYYKKNFNQLRSLVWRDFVEM